MSTNTEIANVILQQLGGGGRIKAMTGAKMFVAVEKGLRFQFPNKDRKRPNSVTIVLNGNDEYDVEFHRVGGTSFKLVEEVTGLQAEDLKSVFEKETGLRLSL